MTELSDWLSWLESQPPKAKDEFKLEPVRTVATRLKLLPVKKPVISVTGTNGKGSCTTACAAILTAAGYKVGSYFSPHLFDYCERIQINGQPVQAAVIVEAFRAIKNAAQELSLSYFEYATLAALWIFKAAEVEAYILEVGIGGRLDAVNIVDAEVAVVTSIGLDHTQWLGETKAEIAFEKAGIFRAGKIAVCGDFDPPRSLAEQAKKLAVSLRQIGQDFHYEVQENHWCWKNSTKNYQDLPLSGLWPSNLACALQALHCSPFQFDETAVRQGLAKVNLPGRFQQTKAPRWQIFDVAHNPPAAAHLALRLQQLPCQGKAWALVGMLKDKDIKATLQALAPAIDAWQLVGLEKFSPRGATVEELAEILTKLDAAKAVFATDNGLETAYQLVLNRLNSEDRLVICGSFYTVANTLSLNILHS